MNLKYKVEYISTVREKGKWYQSGKNAVDAWTMAKEFEAMLTEYDRAGYELFSFEPLITSSDPSDAMGLGTRTDGILVVLKEKE